MIVTRTPLRVPLGGGGTDLPSYYGKHGGYLVSAAINKYIYITVNYRFEENIRISYSRTEIAECVEDIEHPIVREAMKLTGLDSHLEIVSIADLPSNTGLGSSGSFTVGLLEALHAYKRERVDEQRLAEEAFHIEAEILGEPVGKQDQYIAAFGQVIEMDIDKTGLVKTTYVHLPPEVKEQLEHDVMLFYTGIKRSASEVLGDQQKSFAAGKTDPTQSMHEIKAIGHKVADALRCGDLNAFGSLLNEHWQAKKRTSSIMSNSDVDQWYELGLANGALGGKLMGAGGGGFLMFFCPSEHKNRLRQAMNAQGLREMLFTIDDAGSKVIVNV